ncbi:winged helix-turn-helix domain-containing protein [Mycolicibacterium komossense]|nr:winged helix-turn-helix domain-containing protein [Mycolicibacterium komossense]
MYQAVPEPGDAPGTAVQIVLVIEVPPGLSDSAPEAMRLADEFGTLISQWLPGVRAQKAVTSALGAQRQEPLVADRPTGLVIDLANRRVSIDGYPLRLAYREFALLAYLARIPHRTVSRETLLAHVWRDRHAGHADISDRTVDTHIRRLRAKLGEHAHVLTTVRGHGYRFDPGTPGHVRLTNG